MGQLLALVYGVVCYLAFLGTLLYAIWFVWTLDIPRLTFRRLFGLF
jgi:hypothetical protein